LASSPSFRAFLVHGATEADALSKVEALALRVVGEKLEHGEIARPAGVLFEHG
jgi:hypothetical protein